MLGSSVGLALGVLPNDMVLKTKSDWLVQLVQSGTST